MQKRGLKDIKRRNRQVILEAVMEHDGLSRVEIAQKTELAGSTVSSLVAELLTEGFLTEAGTVTTAGRSRTALTVNPRYGTIAVVEISRRETCVTGFDMALKPVKKALLSKRYVCGNELLELIVKAFQSWKEEIPPIVGIGLLFQEDMRESDFHVMYSTGFSSASITLKDALMTQYRVPILEEYSVSYTISNALAGETDPDARNSAHISVGSRVLASITLEGRKVPMRNTFCEDLVPVLRQEEGSGTREQGMGYLSSLIAMLCMLFPLDTVFLSGPAMLAEDVMQTLHLLVRGKLSAEQMPRLKFLQPGPVRDGNRAMAKHVLKKVLIAK